MTQQFNSIDEIPSGFWIWGPEFFPSEFACKGSGELLVIPEFMDKLLALRKALAFPFTITSGYRSPEYNAKISKKTGLSGPHTTGKAADIQVSGGRAFELVTRVREFGFTGIGIKQNGLHHKRFIHLDTLIEPDHKPRPWVWSY